MVDGEIVPLFCGSGELTYGTRTLLKKMVELFPSPAEVKPPVEAPLVGRVFKTLSESHVGDVTLFRLYTGEIRNGGEVFNAEHETIEKLNHLSVQQGKERLEVERLSAGDIGSVAKLKDTHTGDTFCWRGAPGAAAADSVPRRGGHLGGAGQAAGRGGQARGRAAQAARGGSHLPLRVQLGAGPDADPRHGRAPLRHHPEPAGAEVRGPRRAGAPRVAYRETIKGKAEGQGKHKKQSGGRGQYGDCWIRVAPLPRGSGYQFVDEIVGGVIPGKYIPAVDRGIQEAAVRGVIAGYPLVDFKVECFDGSYHDVDSNEMSFKMAGIMAFRNVAPKARPVLLEPLMDVETWAPDDVLGDVMGDLSARRGQILGTEPDGRLTKVRAIVPEAELYKYSTTLHSITHGRGTHRQKFHGYAEAPPDVATRGGGGEPEGASANSVSREREGVNGAARGTSVYRSLFTAYLLDDVSIPG